MQTLDTKVRAQKIYLSHMSRKMGGERASAKRQSQKRSVVLADPGINQRSRIEIAESLRESRQQLVKGTANGTPTDDNKSAEMVLIGESLATPEEVVEQTGANPTD